jgi:DNA polymerase III epsilon subunit family exonuclease
MQALIFDTETNGLAENRTIKLERQPSIIEFYCCLVDLKTGNVAFEFDTLIKPPKPLDEVIVEITGLTDDMLKEQPSFAQVADNIITAIESAPLVIAHNASFDKEMVDIEAGRIGRIIDWPRVLCTVEQTIYLTGKRLTLTALHEYLFGVKFNDAHRAKIDTQALARCCVELYERELL